MYVLFLAQTTISVVTYKSRMKVNLWGAYLNEKGQSARNLIKLGNLVPH